MGRPRHPALVPTVDTAVSLETRGFELLGKTYDAAGTAFFGVWRHPLAEDRVMAVLAYTDEAHGVTVARKIPHYGRYSYLVFEGATNRVKGVWEAAASPLVVTWPAAPGRP
jgi:hypothetical protein